jgi:SNF2 family DNA or RNA helicase
MIYTPRPYMEAAIQFALEREGCGLMLDPGMGKTGIALAVCTIRKVKTLVIAPSRVAKATWIAEGKKWDDFRHLKIVHAVEQNDAGRKQICLSNADVVTINPESAHKILQAPWFAQAGFQQLIVDESTKYKNTQSMRFKALKKLLVSFNYRIILTGTPVPNGLEDIFGQMYIVDFGTSLGKYITHFRMQYMYQRPGDPWSYYMRPGVEGAIYDRVKPYLMRLRATDHLEMPDLIHNTRWIDIPSGLHSKYKELENDYITKIEDQTIAAINPSAAGVKLRQFANGFLYHYPDDTEPTRREVVFLHDQKLQSLEELLEEMQGRPLLLAYEFNEDAKRIQDRFPDICVNLGAAKNPEEIIARFNKGLIPLLIGHPASVGHGLNLQEGCHEVCWYSDTWDLELFIQFNDRIYRQGQKSPYVIVHHISARGTRDEKVSNALSAKDLDQENFNAAILTPL